MAGFAGAHDPLRLRQLLRGKLRNGFFDLGKRAHKGQIAPSTPELQGILSRAEVAAQRTIFRLLKGMRRGPPEDNCPDLKQASGERAEVIWRQIRAHHRDSPLLADALTKNVNSDAEVDKRITPSDDS
jgi:hypothetical protein